MPSRHRFASPLFLIPIAALLAVIPLLLKGCSCGHDMVFHVQGWYDAAPQLRHLHYPRWSFTSAWNAGEPRFIFYPPLSWLLGAVLTLILPPNLAVSAFIFLTLTTAGLTFYKLASHFTTPNAALIASVLYLANPYMLFNAFERSAFAELLAAAWIPLLLLAILRHRPTIPAIAIPVALLWLTNAPAAVMASYTLALLATLRVAQCLCFSGCHSEQSEEPASRAQRVRSSLRLALTYILGTLLGLTLPAFYLIPAAYERRWIQIAMAIIPTMRVQDNFLFSRTQDPGHNGVNLQISLLAVTLLTLTIAAVTALLLLHFRARNQAARLSEAVHPAPPANESVIPSEAHRTAQPTQESVILSEVSRGTMRETQPKDPPPSQTPAISLALLTTALIVMLLPLSTPIWNHLPELAFLQFPWRLLTILSAVLALAIALLVSRTRAGGATTLITTLILPLTLGLTAFHLYAQFCQPTDKPTATAQQIATHHGFPPTDEYTPNDADNDVLRTTNPAYWLLPVNANPNTPAPNTLPTATELDPNLNTDDYVVPLDQRLSNLAPTQLSLTLPQPETLVLNLRDYPAWQINLNQPHEMDVDHPRHISRDDGLLSIPLPAGPSTIDIHWHTTPDQQLGLILSLVALLLLFWLSFRSAAKESASATATTPTR